MVNFMSMFFKKNHNLNQGANSVTHLYEDEHGKLMVGKTKNSSNLAILERSYEKQAKCWNKFYKDTEYEGAIVDSEKLYAPFIEGAYPNHQQHLHCLKEMLKNGYVMQDCKNKENFIVNRNKVFPVDFGLIYSDDENFPCYNAIKVKVQEEIKQLEKQLEKVDYKDISFSTNKQKYLNINNIEQTLNPNNLQKLAFIALTRQKGGVFHPLNTTTGGNNLLKIINADDSNGKYLRSLFLGESVIDRKIRIRDLRAFAIDGAAGLKKTSFIGTSMNDYDKKNESFFSLKNREKNESLTIFLDRHLKNDHDKGLLI